jgi:hypothetical protein
MGGYGSWQFGEVLATDEKKSVPALWTGLLATRSGQSPIGHYALHCSIIDLYFYRQFPVLTCSLMSYISYPYWQTNRIEFRMPRPGENT